MSRSPASHMPLLALDGELTAQQGRRRVRIQGRGGEIDIDLNFLPWSWRSADLSDLPPPLDRLATTWWLYSACVVKVHIHGRHVATLTQASGSPIKRQTHWPALVGAMIVSPFRRGSD